MESAQYKNWIIIIIIIMNALKLLFLSLDESLGVTIKW